MLQWQIDQGVTELLEPAPVNRFALAAVPERVAAPAAKPQALNIIPEMPMGTAEAKKEALRLAQSANSLAELEAAIRSFDGLSIKKTATNLVFSDGNPNAHIMVIGEAPDGDEDVQGKPFAGGNAQLFDKMFAAIGLDRKSEDPDTSLYITNILNWRPPGNRTPSPAEIEVGLPFIERHIALAKPKIIVLMGGTPAKALLNTTDNLVKLRGKWTNYLPLTETGGEELPTLAMLHPSFLIKSPIQKKNAWQDLLLLAKKHADYISK